MSEIESLRQQLAAALAAGKLKDEELEKIRGHIGLYNLFSCVGSDSYDPECADLNVGKCREIATKALTIQPDDSAIKTWLGEPITKVIHYDEVGMPHTIYLNKPLYSPKGLK